MINYSEKNTCGYCREEIPEGCNVCTDCANGLDDIEKSKWLHIRPGMKSEIIRLGKETQQIKKISQELSDELDEIDNQFLIKKAQVIAND